MLYLAFKAKKELGLQVMTIGRTLLAPAAGSLLLILTAKAVELSRPTVLGFAVSILVAAAAYLAVIYLAEREMCCKIMHSIRKGGVI
jgi:hypothetical protein